jgi:cytochrome oxidase Cu insertion factor (SCO1/SenC/PrrC family)
VTSSSHALRSPAPFAAPGNLAHVAARARGYFAADSRRGCQTALALIWLLDGALQFQSFMYSQGFIAALKANETGQPHWLANSIDWGANAAHSDLWLFNTLFALIQVVIGLGLLYRRSVKPALALSIAWALGVWWFGEGFGMIFAGTANPLTGAPGAVILYALIAALVWPSDRPAGLLSAGGARVAWGVLWLFMAYLSLLPANGSANATFNAIMMSPTGMVPHTGMTWLTRIQGRAEIAALGNGEVIALVLAAVSAAIGVAVWVNWRPRPFLALAIVLGLGYWVIGQSFGGIVYTGNATDPNAGPLFVLLAAVMYAFAPAAQPIRARVLRPGVLVASLTAAVAVAVTGTAVAVSAAEAAAPSQQVAYGSPFDGLAFSPPVPAPPVSLRNQQGNRITLSGYQTRGDVVLVTFLPSRCSAGCVQIATELHQALAAMPAGLRRRLKVVAISTDPRNDTGATMTAFVRRYGARGSMQYLTGSAAQLRPVWREWGMAAGPGSGSGSGTDAIVYGIAPGGAVTTQYSIFFTPQQIVHDVRRLASL